MTAQDLLDHVAATYPTRHIDVWFNGELNAPADDVYSVRWDIDGIPCAVNLYNPFEYVARMMAETVTMLDGKR